MAEEDQNQEIGALNREKNTIMHPVSQIPDSSVNIPLLPDQHHISDMAKWR